MRNRISSCAAILVVSFAVLAVLTGEVQAIPINAAACESGRCIKARGYAVWFTDNTPTMVQPAVFTIDLGYGYVGIAAGAFAGRSPIMNIQFSRFAIRVNYDLAYATVRVGLPSYATAYYDLACEPPHCYSLRFYGLASFYNRVDIPMV